MQKTNIKKVVLIVSALALVSSVAVAFISGNPLLAKLNRVSQDAINAVETVTHTSNKINNLMACPAYSPPGPDWCANGKIVPQPEDENGCSMPAKCVESTTTCRVCTGGTLTEEKDSNGCPVYKCPKVKIQEDNEEKNTITEHSKINKPASRFFGWSCKDSDGGINAEEKGTVTVSFALFGKNFSREYVDKNQTKTSVREYYCEKDKMRSSLIECEADAIDGAC